MNQELNIRSLSPEQLALIGMQEIAYIKPLALPEGQIGYGIYTADGRQLAVAANVELAQALVRQNELEPLLAN